MYLYNIIHHIKTLNIRENNKLNLPNTDEHVLIKYTLFK